MAMSNLELDIHISMLWDQSYEQYTSKGLNTPRALYDKRKALCALRWSRVPSALQQWCTMKANVCNILMKDWRQNNRGGEVAV